MGAEIIDIKPLNEVKDPTWGTGVMRKRLALVAVKFSGAISEGERLALMRKASAKNRDCGFRTLSAVDAQGHGLLLIFNIDVVKELGFFPRLLHALRMFKAAITRNVGVSAGVRVIVIE